MRASFRTALCVLDPICYSALWDGHFGDSFHEQLEEARALRVHGIDALGLGPFDELLQAQRIDVA